MIELITGTPGSGKSLLAVEEILNNCNSDDPRPVYSDIAGLDCDKLKCFPLENAEEWYNLPDGSIIVIDECQRIFPPRPNGSKVPQKVSEFETHRHKGFDVILITQGPKLLDPHIRPLIQRHRHCTRPFGREGRTVFEWESCNDNPEPARNHTNASKSNKPFNSDLFGYYKSAVLHTHKKRFPMKYIYSLVGVVLLLLAALAFAGYQISGRFSEFDEMQGSPDPSNVVVPDPSTLKTIEQAFPNRSIGKGSFDLDGLEKTVSTLEDKASKAEKLASDPLEMVIHKITDETIFLAYADYPNLFIDVREFSSFSISMGVIEFKHPHLKYKDDVFRLYAPDLAYSVENGAYQMPTYKNRFIK